MSDRLKEFENSLHEIREVCSLAAKTDSKKQEALLKIEIMCRKLVLDILDYRISKMTSELNALTRDL